MDTTTFENKKQEAIGRVGLVGAPEGEKFDWTAKRGKCMDLATLYEEAGFPDYAIKAGSCATWLQFGASLDGTKRRLQRANFCMTRLCPMCIARRSRKLAVGLSQALDRVDAEHPGTRYIFLTLTLRNATDGASMPETLTALVDSWHRLIRQRPVAAIMKGSYRSLEITVNYSREISDMAAQGATVGQIVRTLQVRRDTVERVLSVHPDLRSYARYHPHIHALVAVEPSYLGPRWEGYIRQDEWVQRWKLALGSGYDPGVDVRVVKPRRTESGEIQRTDVQAAVREVGKYAVKDADYIHPGLPHESAVEIVRDYTIALYRRRLTAYTGWLKSAAQALAVEDAETDQDLVHTGEETVRDEIVQLIETYRWHMGAGDYVLTEVREAGPEDRRDRQ